MKDFIIPVGFIPMEKPQHDFPISPRENLLRAFRHEKPMYMPCLYQSTQFVIPSAYARNTQKMEDCTDWFGTHYKYEKIQKGTTAVKPFVLNDVTEWRKKIRWPDIQSMDWSEIEGYERDSSLATACRCFGNGTFEELHFLEGFEQCLIDMITEPEECNAFFERLVDFKIELFHLQNAVYKYDYACHNDDWSTARAQFFSNEIFEQTLLNPTMRLAAAIKETGCYYMFHTCGMMEAWLPYIVNDIKADLVEIQNINDIKHIMDTYGDKLTVETAPDPYIMFNPETTAEQAREYARHFVDTYGAHKNKGSGVAVLLTGNKPESYYAFEDELYNYSLKCYTAVQ